MNKNVKEFLEYINRRINLLEGELERLERARKGILTKNTLSSLSLNRRRSEPEDRKAV